MATYYYGGKEAGPGGNGLTPETAFDSISDLVTTSGHTHKWKKGVVHKLATIPTGTAITNTGKLLGADTVFDVYGESEDPPIFIGGVEWTGSVVGVEVNGVQCKKLEHSVPINPFWFPQVDEWGCNINRCAPGSLGVDDFMTNPDATDDILPGAKGVRFVPAANYGGTTDPTKEVSYTDTGVGGGHNYHIKIRDIFGFWARANAVESVVGYHIVLRTGANFTYYMHTITSYHPEDGGYIMVDSGTGTNGVPSNGTAGLFFYALIGHPYGLRLPGQYAVLPNNMGWIAALPEGTIDIICYSTLFKTVSDNFDGSASHWHVRGLAHGNEAAGGGCAFYFEQGVNNVDLSAGVTLENGREYGRSGSPVRVAGAGSQTNITVGAINKIRCLGLKAAEIAPTGPASANVTFTGPIKADGSGGGVRMAGFMPANVVQGPFEINDFVIAPCAGVHDNGANIYERILRGAIRNGVATGQTNPGATQWRDIDPPNPPIPPPDEIARIFENTWYSGAVGIDGAKRASSIFRTDDGLRSNSLIRRILSIYGNTTSFGSGAGTEPLDGLVVSHSILDLVGRSSPSDGNTWNGVLFKYCVFCSKVAAASGYASTTDYIRAFGGTVEDCVDLPSEFGGSLTDDMWRVLTLRNDYSGYDPLPWLAPQLGLTLPAYGSARTISRPAYVAGSLAKGHQAGYQMGTLINPNPLSTMTLPAGLGDNALLNSTLAGGHTVRPLVDIPDQPTLTMVVRITDAGAVNGPSQDFSYVIPIRRWTAVPGPDPEPIIIPGGRNRIKLARAR